MITTNHHWREFKGRYEVPASVIADQFDYHEFKCYECKASHQDKGQDHQVSCPECGSNDYWPETLQGFFQYKNTWYHLDQFMRGAIEDYWDGSMAHGFTIGVVIKLSEDGEQYQVGTWRA